MSVDRSEDSEFEGEAAQLLVSADGRRISLRPSRRASVVAVAAILLVGTLAVGASIVARGRSPAHTVVRDVQHPAEVKQSVVFNGPLGKLLSGGGWGSPAGGAAPPTAAPPPTPATTPANSTCGSVEAGVNYPGNDLYRVDDVVSADACCRACNTEDKCVAWSLTSGTCFLKGMRPRRYVTKVLDPAFTSGLPPQRRISVVKRQGDSLYCFSLMQTVGGFEKKLLQLQYASSGGIFACDEYTVYSNVFMHVAPGVQTSVINVRSLKVQIGGEFTAPLNTNVFLYTWAKVAEDGWYQHHDWTVKADPDTVFLPDRLRLIVRRHLGAASRATGVYLNNCGHGLHGPLEVLSRNAARAWAMGRTACVKRFNQLCKGPCQWGEDVFIDQCLGKLLHVQRLNDFSILMEAACDPPAGWDSCKGHTNVASFHPFKNPANYARCLSNARASGVR